jgi:hypothetical protein
MERKGYSGSFGGTIIRKIFRKIWILILLILDKK